MAVTIKRNIRLRNSDVNLAALTSLLFFKILRNNLLHAGILNTGHHLMSYQIDISPIKRNVFEQDVKCQ